MKDSKDGKRFQASDFFIFVIYILKEFIAFIIC